MKLRIEGNSLRLRVTQAELNRLKSGGEVAEIIHFGPELQGNLRYTLVTAEQLLPVMVSFNNSAIAVSIAPKEFESWLEESRDGIYAKLETGATGPLEVILEKDFKGGGGRDER